MFTDSGSLLAASLGSKKKVFGAQLLALGTIRIGKPKFGALRAKFEALSLIFWKLGYGLRSTKFGALQARFGIVGAQFGALETIVFGVLGI